MSKKKARCLMERSIKARSSISKIGTVFDSQRANLLSIVIHKALNCLIHKAEILRFGLKTLF